MGIFDWAFGKKTPQPQQPQRTAAPVPPVPMVAQPNLPGLGGPVGGLDIPTPQPLPIMSGNTDFIARGHHIDPKTGDTRRDPQTGAPMLPMTPMGGASGSELNSTATVPTMVNAPMPPSRPGDLGLRPPPGVPLPPRRPASLMASADLPAPGAVNAGPSTPATGTPAGPGYEYYQTTDDNGRTMWSTRPTGYAGAMPGAGQATAPFQNAGSGMSFNQAQQSIGAGGAGSGIGNFFSALGGNMPPGANGRPSVPPGALQGPMPNGQSLDQVQPQQSGFQNPLVADPNGSAASNFFKFLGLGGF